MKTQEAVESFDYNKYSIKALGGEESVSSSGKKIFDKVAGFKAHKLVRDMGIYPFFREIETMQNPVVKVNGQELVMMGSNNYLGLVSEPRVIEAAREMAKRYGTGCAGSRLLNGTTDIHIQLEEELAEFVEKEACLLYSTGYQANLGGIAGIVGRRETVIMDKKNHASIVDAVTLSRGEVVRFAHNDMEDLERKLKLVDTSKYGAMIIVDGVFSMEGDVINLPEVQRLAEKYNMGLIVDDAHGLGVMGEMGRGTANHFGLSDKADMIIGTFSKSLASIGGFVAADKDLIEYLRHHSRSMIFSASMPPASVGSVLKALEIIRTEPERLERLWQNTSFLKEGLLSLGFNLGDSTTPILPVYCGNDLKAFQMCMMLSEEGVFVNPVPGLSLSPADALIRVSLMATHERSHLEFSLEKFEKVGKALEII